MSDFFTLVFAVSIFVFGVILMDKDNKESLEKKCNSMCVSEQGYVKWSIRSSTECYCKENEHLFLRAIL
jgi:hypothetical protein